MASADRPGGISRRTLLIGGGVGVGLALAWGLWPRAYPPNLRTGPGEQVFNAFLKIATDGRVIVAVPQAEIGQGVWTSLPQIVADELGADWRTVAVEPAPVHPLYANDFLAEEIAAGELPSAFQGIGRWAAREYATRNAIMLTGGSTSVRAFEPRLREAGAAARALLAKAAAERWDVEWETLDTRAGFVVEGERRIAFAELAERAAALDVPEVLQMRGGIANRLAGEPLPRLDLPAKVDGSAMFAGDVRLPDMVFASVRQGPIGGSRLVRTDKAAALKVPGVVAAFANPGWAAVAATNWWAADRGLQAMKPTFLSTGALVDSAAVEDALREALAGGEATEMFGVGDVEAAFAGGTIVRGRYAVGAVANAPLETLTATARLTGDRLEVWAPTQAPGLARAAAARAAGIGEGQVTLYPTLVGSGYGRKLETEAIGQAVAMAAELKRPVQLVWSRPEETMQDTVRPPALAAIEARVEGGGSILGWRARIAVPAAAGEAIARLEGGTGGGGEADAAAIDGAIPPYGIPAIAVAHVPVETGLRTGIWRSGAHSYTAFFTESFIDEIARKAGLEPLSFRMQMLGGNPRLARCLSTAAALGGWDGGGTGSNMGLACHSAYGSHIATLVEIAIGEDRRVRVARAVCAVDCGRVVNPEIVRQLIEGGTIYGIAGATGARLRFEDGLPTARGFRDLALPRLADSPEVTVEIVASDEPPGGVTELGVPPVGPAIANAVHALTGERLRMLPLKIGTGS